VTVLFEARDLVKSFGGLCATNHVSLHVNEGETLGIIGPNGAGKTTLFNLFSNEITADAGDVILQGKSLKNVSTDRRVRAGLVRTYQVPRPFHGLTVRENIRISMLPDSLKLLLSEPPDLDRETELARSVGLRLDQLDALPSELAMGDLRKLELARTLATNPKLIMLDEVFAGLTYGEIEQISELLAERKKSAGMTYMIVSHDLKALAPLVDRVVVINFGEVLIEGSFNDVINNADVQSAYLGSEFDLEAAS
jgi:branched-chain amino acid transport system ATP-binding protein